MGFHVELSSDINGLIRALGDQLQRDLQGERIDLFHSPSIIVPHANLARWATLRLAHHLGIAANLDFPYLEGALWQALTEHDTAQHHPTRLDATTLQRLINALFTAQTALRDDPVMQPMWEYISGGATLPDDWPSDTQRRAWQLADRVARLFLEYECQRPEMIDRIGDRLRITIPFLFVHLPCRFPSTFSGLDGAFVESFQLGVELRRSHRATGVRPLAQHCGRDRILSTQPGRRPLADTLGRGRQGRE